MTAHLSGVVISTTPFKAIIRHEEVEVLGSKILVAVTADGEFVSPRHMCEAVGLAWPRQYQKIKDDEVLGSVVTQMGTTAADGKTYKNVMLPLSMISGWLFKINPNRVAPEVKQELIKYQTEAYAVLDAWLCKNARAEVDPEKMQNKELGLYQGHAIKVSDGMISLTNMWKACGSKDSMKPADWIRHLGTRKLLLAMEENVKYESHSYFTEVKMGRYGGTFAHPIIGLAYAKYLSPSFHMPLPPLAKYPQLDPDPTCTKIEKPRHPHKGTGADTTHQPELVLHNRTGIIVVQRDGFSGLGRVVDVPFLIDQMTIHERDVDHRFSTQFNFHRKVLS